MGSEEPDKFPDKFERFIRKHHVMTLASVGSDGSPWVAHAFYAWMPAEKKVPGRQNDPENGADELFEAGSFVFMCNPGTRHGAEMESNGNVAAAIVLETRVVGRLQGLQMEGVVRRAEGGDAERARRTYLRRFPYTVAIEEQLWLLEPTLMKLTDNTLGFGKKLIRGKPRSGQNDTK